MDYKKEMLTGFISSIEILQQFMEPPETIFHQMVSWINQVTAGIKMVGTDEEIDLWEKALMNAQFTEDESSLPAHMLSLKSVLLGMLGKINSGSLEHDNLIDVVVNDKFYNDLIDEINSIYHYGFVLALPVLIRKLLENLIIDILRKQYGTGGLLLYYDPDKHRFNDFSILIKNLKNKKGDFLYITENLDNEIIKKIDAFREKGNSAAHSIDASVTIKSFTEIKDDLNYIVNFLLHIHQTIPVNSYTI